jgi:hypothetical protein
MIYADGLILATDGANMLYLIEPDPSAFKPLASTEILKPGGVLAVHEPNIFFPPGVLARYLRALIGNVTGLVPDERPVNPTAVTQCLKRAGFTRIRAIGLSISHIRYPVFLQAANLMIDAPFRRIWPLTLLCNGIGWFCEKK